MPNPPLLRTLIQRRRQLLQAIADFSDLLVRIDNLGAQTPPTHPRFGLLRSLYERLFDLVATLVVAKDDLSRQIELLSRV